MVSDLGVQVLGSVVCLWFYDIKIWVLWLAFLRLCVRVQVLVVRFLYGLTFHGLGVRGYLLWLRLRGLERMVAFCVLGFGFMV